MIMVDIRHQAALSDYAAQRQDRSMKMNDTHLISRTTTLVEAAMADELFALDIDNGHCFSFNASATAVWQSLETPRTVAELRTILMDDFAVDQATCDADLAALIDTLAGQRLISVTPQ
jgi:hypothetical protein